MMHINNIDDRFTEVSGAFICNLNAFIKTDVENFNGDEIVELVQNIFNQAALINFLHLHKGSDNHPWLSHDVKVLKESPIFQKLGKLLGMDILQSRFLHAITYGKRTDVEIYFLAGADINSRSICRDSALMIAVDWNHLNILQYLVKNGADVNAKGACGHTALMFACRLGNPEIIRYLVENGADINAYDIYGDSPLKDAIMWGSLDMVQYLVEKGADVNSQNGLSPLKCAIRTRNQEIIQYLIKKGANVNEESLWQDDDMFIPINEA